VTQDDDFNDMEPFPRKTGHGFLGLRQEHYEPGQRLEREQTEERLYGRV
jgi:hypothetical protein